MGSKNQQTTVVGAVNADIKEGERLGKCVQKSIVLTCVSGACIEHINNVEGEEDVGLSLEVIDVVDSQEVLQVCDGIDATIKSNAELAKGEEVGSEAVMKVSHNDGNRWCQC
jgi:hypothetical protein